MPYKTGSWGFDAKARSQTRLQYFREYHPGKSFGLGRLGEKVSESILRGSVRRDDAYRDYEWEGKDIEVKSGTIRDDKTYRFTFSKAQLDDADFGLCLGFNESKIVERLYLIPNGALAAGISISSGESKYQPFRVY